MNKPTATTYPQNPAPQNPQERIFVFRVLASVRDKDLPDSESHPVVVEVEVSGKDESAAKRHFGKAFEKFIKMDQAEEQKKVLEKIIGRLSTVETCVDSTPTVKKPYVLSEYSEKGVKP